MTDPEQRLAELGLVLPPQRTAMGNYVGATQEGNIVFLAGHGPYSGTTQLYKASSAGSSTSPPATSPPAPPCSARSPR